MLTRLLQGYHNIVELCDNVSTILQRSNWSMYISDGCSTIMLCQNVKIVVYCTYTHMHIPVLSISGISPPVLAAVYYNNYCLPSKNSYGRDLSFL